MLSVAREQGRCDAGLGTSAKHCYAPGVLAYLLRTLWGSLRAGRGLWGGTNPPPGSAVPGPRPSNARSRPNAAIEHPKFGPMFGQQ